MDSPTSSEKHANTTNLSITPPPTPRTAELNRQLCAAAKAGRHEEIPELVTAGANINAVNNRDEKLTPLMLAVIDGHIETVKLLLSYPNINTDVKNEDYETAAVIANKIANQQADRRVISDLVSSHRAAASSITESSPRHSPRTRSRSPKSVSPKSSQQRSTSTSPKHDAPPISPRTPRNLDIPFSRTTPAAQLSVDFESMSLSLSPRGNPPVTFAHSPRAAATNEFETTSSSTSSTPVHQNRESAVDSKRSFEF